MNFKEWQKNQKVILIDGSMSLGLEEQGLDLNDELWTAKALVNEPGFAPAFALLKSDSEYSRKPQDAHSLGR